MEAWLWGTFGVLVLILVGMLLSQRRREDKDAPTKTKTKDDARAKPRPPASRAAAKPAVEEKKPAALPVLANDDDEEDDVDPTKIGELGAKGPRKLQPPTKKIVYDEDAVNEEPTRATALILVTAQAQTDKGLRRRRNEDSILSMPEHGLYVVADGMGGYKGGDIASALAVSTIERAFRTSEFAAEPHENIPPRASELARAVQMANEAILDKAQTEPELAGMGTTICAAQFALNKRRLYVGHVGDSRLYRVRDGALSRMTSDHTMGDLGVTGPQAAHLSRAVGIWPTVAIDIVLATPAAGDLYVLCSDGLTKMVSDDEILKLATSHSEPGEIVTALIDAANANGGKDNVSVIVLRVRDAVGAA